MFPERGRGSPVRRAPVRRRTHTMATGNAGRAPPTPRRCRPARRPRAIVRVPPLRAFTPSRMPGARKGSIALPKRRKQMPDFFVNLGRTRNGVGDFLAQELPVTLAQPVHGHFHGAFGRAELTGNRGVGNFALVGSEKRFQRGELLRVALGFQSCEYSIEQRDGPLTVEQLVGTQLIRWL